MKTTEKTVDVRFVLSSAAIACCLVTGPLFVYLYLIFIMSSETSSMLQWLIPLVSVVVSVIATAIGTAFTVSWRLNGRLTKIESEQKLLETNILHRFDLLELKLNERFDRLDSDNEKLLDIIATHMKATVVIAEETGEQISLSSKSTEEIGKLRLLAEGIDKSKKRNNPKKST